MNLVELFDINEKARYLMVYLTNTLILINNKTLQLI